MARRYIGDANIYLLYEDLGKPRYRGSIVVPSKDSPPMVWKFTDIHPPPCGFGRGVAYDSPEAYDRVAQSAVSFGTYPSIEAGDGFPSKEVADAIDNAISMAVLGDDDDSCWTFEVRRKK